MAFEIQLQRDEQILAHELWSASRDSEPMAFAVSNQALYLREKIRGFVRDTPWRFARVPLSQVRGVELVRLRPYGWYVLALVFFIGAMAGFLPVLLGEGGIIKGAHFGALAASLVIPFLARGRKAIRVTTDQKTFTFKPPFVVDRVSRQKIAGIHDTFIAGCRKAGVPVTGSSAG